MGHIYRVCIYVYVCILMCVIIVDELTKANSKQLRCLAINKYIILTFHVHDKFYIIHRINNIKGMVRGDGGFTEGMLFVISFHQRDAVPPHPPSIRALVIGL